MNKEKQAAIESAAQTFALKFLERTYKPPITSFQVEQIWLNGVNFARQQLEAQKSQVIAEERKRIADDLDSLIRARYLGDVGHLISTYIEKLRKPVTAPEVCECGVPVYLHGSLTSCVLPKLKGGM